MKNTVYSQIAYLLIAMDNCSKAGNSEWPAKHEQSIVSLVKASMPSGSGVDCGTKLDMDRSRPDRLVFTFSYHHMDENGYYAGWADYSAIVAPSLAFGFDVRIVGHDRNDMKSYLHELFSQALSAQYEQTVGGWKIARSV